MDNQPSPKAQQALAAVLEPGEEVRVWACGRYGSVAIVTDRRLHVYKCEPLTRPKMTSWPLGEVTGLSLHKGLTPFMAVDLLGDSNMPKSTSPNTMSVRSDRRYEQAEQDIRALRRAIAPDQAAVTTSGVDAGPVGEELAMLTQAWTLPAIIRTYERDDAGRRLLAAEVQVLGQHGYSPAGQDEGAGHHEAGRILLKGTTTVLFGVVGGMMVGTKSKGTITVAFQKTQVPPPAPAAADPMEQVRKLGELRDAGVLTPVEFETKKAELLSRL